jgi:hypothetical protein
MDVVTDAAFGQLARRAHRSPGFMGDRSLAKQNFPVIPLLEGFFTRFTEGLRLDVPVCPALYLARIVCRVVDTDVVRTDVSIFGHVEAFFDPGLRGSEV